MSHPGLRKNAMKRHNEFNKQTQLLQYFLMLNPV